MIVLVSQPAILIQMPGVMTDFAAIMLFSEFATATAPQQICR